MSQSQATINLRLDDILAQVRALKYAVVHKAIRYEEAKKKSEALLQIVNEAGGKVAKKYGRTYRKIRFSDL